MSTNRFMFLLISIKRISRSKIVGISIDMTFITIYLVQLWMVTFSYLLFDVATHVHMNYPKEFKAPAISLCTSFANIIDLKRAKKLHPNLMSMKHPLQVDEKRQIQDILSVNEIFQLTPQIVDTQTLSISSALLTRCRVRNASSYSIPSYDHQQCLKLFTIQRFLLQESICYDFQFNSTEQSHYYNVYRLSQSLTHSGLFFKFVFNANQSHLYWSRKMRIVAHSEDALPLLSYSLAPVVWRRSLKGSELNKFIVSYSMVKLILLPKPYVTKCTEHVSHGDCSRSCLQRLTLDRFNRLPFTILMAEKKLQDESIPGDKRILSLDDLNQKNAEKKVEEINRLCQIECPYITCRRDYTMTQTISFKSLDDDYIKVEVGSMSQPFIEVTSLPAIGLNDYVLLVLSLTNLWLGYGVRDTLEVFYCLISRVPCVIRKIQKSKPKPSIIDRLGFTLFCVESRIKNLKQISQHYELLKNHLKK